MPPRGPRNGRPDRARRARPQPRGRTRARDLARAPKSPTRPARRPRIKAGPKAIIPVSAGRRCLIRVPETPMGIKHLAEIPRRRIGRWALFCCWPLRHPLTSNPPAEKSSMNRIRAARQSLGWTQNDLAKKANVSPRTIHAVEKGRPCRQATKRHILNALGVPWELRDEYFVRARSVRPLVSAMDEARSA